MANTCSEVVLGSLTNRWFVQFVKQFLLQEPGEWTKNAPHFRSLSIHWQTA